MLSVDVIFIYTSSARQSDKAEAHKTHKKFGDTLGDHFTLLNVYRSYCEAGRNKKEKTKWCKKNFLNSRSLKKAVNIRRQLSELYERHIGEIVRCDDVVKVGKERKVEKMDMDGEDTKEEETKEEEPQS